MPASDTPPRALVLFLHDYSLHSGIYTPFFSLLNREALSVFSFDFEGFGQSAGLKGDIREFVYYMDDLQQIVSHLKREHPDLPIVLTGHGMGALVASLAIKRLDQQIAGTLLLAPILKFSKQVPKIVRDAVKYISTMAATFPIMKLEQNLFSEDEALCRHLEDDEEALNGKLRARMAAHMVKAAKKTRSNLIHITKPTLLMQGECDRLVDVAFTQSILERIDVSSLDISWLEGAGHLFMLESCAEESVLQISTWLEKRKIGSEAVTAN